MIELSVREVAEALNAQLSGTIPSGSSAFPPVSIDSRTLQSGQCFVAIEGERFDGHSFVEDALEGGASSIVHSLDIPKSSKWEDRLFLRVADTTKALQDLSLCTRQKWGKRLVAISGSMGKTTTREFTAALLSERLKVFQSPGNLNNHIGVPLSLLQLTLEDEFAVLELGMNHPGEIRTLTHICAPDMALLTNVDAVHLEFFSDLDEIAAAKGEILEALHPEGCFIFNADDPRLSELASSYPGPKMGFAIHHEAPVRVVDYHFEQLQKMSFEIDVCGKTLSGSVPFVGVHFLYNLAGAVAVCVSAELSPGALSQALAKLRVPSMRGQIRQILLDEMGSLTIWDDSYNSNPGALNMVLDAVAQLRGFSRTILALGEMLELGPCSLKLHQKAGKHTAVRQADLLVTVGQSAVHIGEGAREHGLSGKKIAHFADSEEAAAFLSEQVRPGDFLLVKGSRRIRMEKIIQKISESRTS